MSCHSMDDTHSEDCVVQGPFVYASLSMRDVRTVIFHLLYALEAYDYQESIDTIVHSFNTGFDLDIPLDSRAVKVSQAVADERDALDEMIKPLLVNWRFERVGLCTKLILRLAAWELQKQEAPANIIINEAIELAKCFAEKDAHKFINGILDELAKGLAPQAEA
jgi:N utilization substance protein B